MCTYLGKIQQESDNRDLFISQRSAVFLGQKAPSIYPAVNSSAVSSAADAVCGCRSDPSPQGMFRFPHRQRIAQIHGCAAQIGWGISITRKQGAHRKHKPVFQKSFLCGIILVWKINYPSCQLPQNSHLSQFVATTFFGVRILINAMVPE